MISIIITTYKEPKTIGKAIESFLRQDIKDIEILVVAPDKETLDVAKKYEKVKIIKEPVKAGKSAAINMAIKYVSQKSEIVILSDGDVYVSKNSLSNLLHFFNNKKIGAVSGNPVSLNQKNNKYGYWAYLLTRIADLRRRRAVKAKKRFFCSGYLFAIRKKLLPKLPKELLSEDGYISHKVYEQGYSIAYSPKSEVFVNYPTNFNDWIIQKKRSAGGYNQNYKILGVKMRSFTSESIGFFDFFKFVSSLREFFWLIQLFLARIYLWLVIYRDINIKKKKSGEIWQRVESTK